MVFLCGLQCGWIVLFGLECECVVLVYLQVQYVGIVLVYGVVDLGVLVGVDEGENWVLLYLLECGQYVVGDIVGKGDMVVVGGM